MSKHNWFGGTKVVLKRPRVLEGIDNVRKTQTGEFVTAIRKSFYTGFITNAIARLNVSGPSVYGLPTVFLGKTDVHFLTSQDGGIWSTGRVGVKIVLVEK